MSAREATRAEAFDATVCRVFYHMLYLGEVYRLAVARGNEEVSRIVRRRLDVSRPRFRSRGRRVARTQHRDRTDVNHVPRHDSLAMQNKMWD